MLNLSQDEIFKVFDYLRETMEEWKARAEKLKLDGKKATKKSEGWEEDGKSKSTFHKLALSKVHSNYSKGQGRGKGYD